MGRQKFSNSIFFLAIAVSAAVTAGFFSSPAYAQLPSAPRPVIGDVYVNFFGGYPEARNNSEIMQFIDTYGLSGFYNEKALPGSYDYMFVYLLPGRESPEKMVFLDHVVYEDGRKNETILWARLIDKDLELPTLNESECLALGIEYRKDISASAIGGFTISQAVFSITLMVTLSALFAYRKTI